MPKDKSKTLERILPAARAEFLQRGYAGASMRGIAARAGITAAGLYSHFDSKEALFEALVAPVYTEFIDRYRTEGETHLAVLAQEGMEPMWEASGRTMRQFMTYIYDHLDVFRLLISCSEQTPYERFTHTLIELDIDMTLQYLQLAREMGLPVRAVSRGEMHILSGAQFSCIYEMVLHNIPKEQAFEMADRFSGFFSAGWRYLLLE